MNNIQIPCKLAFFMLLLLGVIFGFNKKTNVSSIYLAVAVSLENLKFIVSTINKQLEYTTSSYLKSIPIILFWHIVRFFCMMFCYMIHTLSDFSRVPILTMVFIKGLANLMYQVATEISITGCVNIEFFIFYIKYSDTALTVYCEFIFCTVLLCCSPNMIVILFSSCFLLRTPLTKHTIAIMLIKCCEWRYHSYGALYLLIILAGDVELNPGPCAGITFVSANVCSILSKLPQIASELYPRNFDLYLFCETWLNEDIKDAEFAKIGYDIFRRDRSKTERGGGVLIMSKLDLKFQELKIPGLQSEFVIAVNRKMMVVCFYRPEYVKSIFVEDFSRILEVHKSKYSHCKLLLTGDANLKSITSWYSGNIRLSESDTRTCKDFLQKLSEYSLVQKVDKPTRGTSILDIVVSNCPDCVDVNVEPGMSDHDLITGRQLIKIQRFKQFQHKVYLWDKVDWSTIRESVNDKLRNYEDQIQDIDVNVAWNILHKVISGVQNKIPSRIAQRRKDAPFMNISLKRRLRRRRRLYKKARSSGSLLDWQVYEQDCKEVKVLLKKAKECYFNRLLLGNFDNRRFYRLVNSKRVDRVGIPDLKVGDSVFQSDEDKVEILNKTFSEVFQVEPVGQVPFIGESPYVNMPDITWHESGVMNLLSKQKENKAAGSDGIPSILLKRLAAVLAKPLTNLFRKCYVEGVCPDGWRSANVCPVYKGRGSRSDPAMYRPISLTPICCKVFEHVVASNMMSFLNENNILRQEQFGFRKGRSCELQLILFVEEVLREYDIGTEVDAVFLDMARAFDKVPHKRLLEKLRFYGVRGKVLDWIGSYLRNRSQVVIIDGNKSSPKPVTSGVPQGSVLGPFLFLLYINDLPEVLHSMKIRLFADDCVVYKSVKENLDILSVQCDLNRIADWAKKWMMQFNVDKCALVQFSKKKEKIDVAYKLDDKTVPVKPVYKYLGVTLHEKFRWDIHIDNIISKASRSLGYFRRNLKGCHRKIKQRVYETMVRPQLEYASVVWSPYKRNLATVSVLEERIEQIQRQSARWVANDYSYTTSVSGIQNMLEWPTLSHRRKVDRLCLMFKVVHMLVDVPSNCITKKLEKDIRGSRGTHELSLVVPKARGDIRRGSFFVDAVNDWNKLSVDKLAAGSLMEFRKVVF